MQKKEKEEEQKLDKKFKEELDKETRELTSKHEAEKQARTDLSGDQAQLVSNKLPYRFKANLIYYLLNLNIGTYVTYVPIGGFWYM